MKTAGPDCVHDFVSDFGRRHLGLQVVGCHLWGRNEDPLLTREHSLTPAIEEKRDMRVFLGFRDAKLLETEFRCVLAERFGDIFRRKQRVHQSAKPIGVFGEAGRE